MKPEQWHRRHAILLASSLPDNVEDAFLVLQAAHELVETFLRPQPADPLPANVRPLRGQQP